MEDILESEQQYRRMFIKGTVMDSFIMYLDDLYKAVLGFCIFPGNQHFF